MGNDLLMRHDISETTLVKIPALVIYRATSKKYAEVTESIAKQINSIEKFVSQTQKELNKNLSLNDEEFYKKYQLNKATNNSPKVTILIFHNVNVFNIFYIKFMIIE